MTQFWARTRRGLNLRTMWSSKWSLCWIITFQTRIWSRISSFSNTSGATSKDTSPLSSSPVSKSSNICQGQLSFCCSKTMQVVGSIPVVEIDFFRSDWRVTAFCCKSSCQLELNHSGTKVKRKDQLPHIDLPTTSIKTILAKVPSDEVNMTVDEVTPYPSSRG